MDDRGPAKAGRPGGVGHRERSPVLEETQHRFRELSLRGGTRSRLLGFALGLDKIMVRLTTEETSLPGDNR